MPNRKAKIKMEQRFWKDVHRTKKVKTLVKNEEEEMFGKTDILGGSIAG